jgi:ATP-binding cassette subfamily C protein
VGPSALFDLPWMPLYLGICYLFHPWIGIAATGGAVLLITITLCTEFLTRAPARAAAGLEASRNSLAEAGRRDAEAVHPMGMTRRLGLQWRECNRTTWRHITVLPMLPSAGGLSKVLRLVLQSAVLDPRLSRDPAGSDGGYHYCSLDPDIAGARAAVRRVPVEGFCLGAAG